jgi:hypothetical protein
MRMETVISEAVARLRLVISECEEQGVAAGSRLEAELEAARRALATYESNVCASDSAAAVKGAAAVRISRWV